LGAKRHLRSKPLGRRIGRFALKEMTLWLDSRTQGSDSVFVALRATFEAFVVLFLT
jgi:hypothetical protein